MPSTPPADRATTAQDIRDALRVVADPTQVPWTSRFFGAVPGGYAEHDRVLGVRVPKQRAIVRQHWRTTSRAEVEKLLRGGAHEERLTAVLLLVEQYRRGGDSEKAAIVALYLAAKDQVNNWDLIDSSAPHILGDWLLDRDRGLLDDLVRSEDVWDRRIAVLATFAFLRHGDYAWTLRLAELLLTDSHHLIHKAVGWMLREIANRDEATALEFLAVHQREMPRTMLRYAIERLDPDTRRALMAGTFAMP